MNAGENSEILQVLEDVELSLEANSELASQMLEFTHHGEESRLRVVNLHGLLQKTARMSTVGNNVQPELSIQRDLWDVEIDSVQMRQVFQNIIINGCQAMPSGGPMRISARNASVGEGNAFDLAPGDYVVIGIKDRGCGIPPDIIDKVFDPYFTTKPDGTGIGLASCKQIVERHKGKLMVESVVNAGTEFILFLPAVGVESELPSAVTGPSRKPQKTLASATREFLGENVRDKGLNMGNSGKHRILVIDDDPMICKLASKILIHLGYEPEVAEDGEKALAAIQHSFREGRSFSAVILDLNLPRMSGIEVMKEIRKLDSNVKIILSSGDPLSNSDLAKDWDGILSKPYGKVAMENVLLNVLKSCSSRGAGVERGGWLNGHLARWRRFRCLYVRKNGQGCPFYLWEFARFQDANWFSSTCNRFRTPG